MLRFPPRFARHDNSFHCDQLSPMNKRQFTAGTLAFAFGVAVALVLPRLLGAQNAPTVSQSLSVPQGKIDISLPQQPSDPSEKELLDWVRNAANAVSTYYGRFPVPHLMLKVRLDDRHGVHHGVTYPEDGGLIVISVGSGTTRKGLDEDWTLTHEMIHLAFPSMDRYHHWIEEGISVYVEPVARAQVGNMTVDDVWKQFIRDMPQGQPQAGDEGLDRTHTWGRTYWGGAMFCLLADVQIREQTANRKGLQDALRAIRDQGGVISEDWPIERAFSVGDKATGTDVLQKLYGEMRDKPAPADLEGLWKKLGVSLKNGQVVYDDHAPEANIRRAITAKRPTQGVASK